MFLTINSDIVIIENGVKSPILKKKASRLDAVLLKYHPISRDSGEWNQITLAEDYLSQLNHDALVLKTAYALIHDKKDIDSYDPLGPALDDLYLKANACLLNNGYAVGSVPVKVHTKKAGIEVSNWRVVCMAKILRFFTNFSPTAFPQLSSPTKWELAPGNYIMWAEDPETGRKSSQQEIPVDRNQECDLAVP